MQSQSLYLAALAPLIELFGLLAVVGVFALLRSQADRRTYFRTWEMSWVLLAVAMTSGIFYERFVDPESVFYPASSVTTFSAATLYAALRLASLGLVVAGTRLFVSGSAPHWLRLAALAGAVTLAVDTRHEHLAPLTLVVGPFAIVAYGWTAAAFAALPASRRSAGTVGVTIFSGGLALLAAALSVFYLLQRGNAPVTGMPWVVRFARYGFYTDLLLQLGLAWAMVRLLIEDGRHESDDVRAHLKLVQERDQSAELYDAGTRLLGRRAFDAMVGLDFARASFGSVARIQLTNYDQVSDEQAPAVAESLLAHVAGVLESSLREHDRVYRWGWNELLAVMPRAIPSVARSRVESVVNRAAAIHTTATSEYARPAARQTGRVAALTPVRANVAIDVAAFRGGEDLAKAADSISQD